MGRKTETREFGEVKVIVTQHPSTEALELLGKLSGVLSPALAKLKNLNEESDLSDLGPVLEAVSTRLAGQTGEMVAELFRHAQGQRGGEIRSLASSANRDWLFDGDIMAYVKATAFSLEVNFGRFLSQLGELAALRRGKETSEST